MARFDIFGMQESALYLRAQRQEILANNLANADTPNFKARDIDFQAALKAAETQRQGIALNLTQTEHLEGYGEQGNPFLLYRNPTQPSLDGNTVEGHIEKAQFMENSLRYQTAMEFISSRVQTLKLAIKGQ